MEEVRALFLQYYRAKTVADLKAVERTAQTLAKEWCVAPAHIFSEFLDVIWQMKRAGSTAELKLWEAHGLQLASQLRITKR